MPDELPTVLDVVILLLIACAALVALSDIVFSFWNRRHQQYLDEIEKDLQALSEKNDEMDKTYQEIMKSIESQHAALLDKVTEELTQLELGVNFLTASTRQSSALSNLLSEQIHSLSEYTANLSKDNNSKAEIQAAILESHTEFTGGEANEKANVQFDRFC